MRKSEIFIKIQNHTSELLGLDKLDIEMDSDFRNDLGCDSLLMSELLMEFEDQFELQISDIEAEGLSTVSSVVDYVLKSLPESPSV